MKPPYADLVSRIQVREVVNDPQSSGGMDTTYTVKATVWGSVKPLSMTSQIGFYVRDVQVKGQPTHVIRLRVNKELGVTRKDLQGNMYLYIEDKTGEGRSFRILCPVDKDDRGSEMAVLVREIGLQFGTDGLT